MSWQEYFSDIENGDPETMEPEIRVLHKERREQAARRQAIRDEFPPVFTLRSVSGIEPFPDYRPRFRIAEGAGSIPFPFSDETPIGLDVQPNPITQRWHLVRDGVEQRSYKNVITLVGGQWLGIKQLREEWLPGPVSYRFAAAVADVVDRMKASIKECQGSPEDLSIHMTEYYYRLLILVNNESARFESGWAQSLKQIEVMNIAEEARLARVFTQEEAGKRGQGKA